MSPLRLERHELGPRLFVLDKRVHEWMLGASLLASIGPLVFLDVISMRKATPLLAGVGGWLLIKDWQDLTSSRRDRGRWSLGLHRIPAALHAHQGDGTAS